MQDIVYSSAHEIAAGIRRREVSVSEVVAAHLAHIRTRNPALNAIVTLEEEAASRRARLADEALARGEVWGPLHGVPLTLKDCLAVAGMRTTAGFAPLADYVPSADATVTARLRAAGAIILGKTNVPVLASDAQTANPLFGRTNNPWNLSRTPGGSSGGAAAAVAAGLVPLEIGSDLGGSIRIPSHFCGVFGLKPTEHRVSIAGHIPDLPGAPRSVRIMGVVGPLARDVTDLSLALRIIAGADGRDTEVPPVPVSERPGRALRDLRIAWAPTFPDVPVAQDIRHSIERLASELSRLGAVVEEKLPPIDFPAQRQLFSDLVETVIRVFNPAATAPFVNLADYLRALDRRDRYIREWEAFLTQWDVLLCPPAMTGAFEHCETGAALDVDGVPVRYWEILSHCCPFNLTGQPAVVMPAGVDRRGLPIGVQLVGQRWGDERLLAIAGAISEVAGGFQRPPDFPAT